MRAMRSKLEFLVLLQFVIRANGSGFKILALLPYFGKSHWEVSRPLLEELARRGNNVTVLSHFPRETPLKNYRDISMVGSTMSHPVHSKDFDTIGSASRLKEMKGTINNTCPYKTRYTKGRERNFSL